LNPDLYPSLKDTPILTGEGYGTILESGFQMSEELSKLETSFFVLIGKDSE
jgi:hypothetical protein